VAKAGHWVNEVSDFDETDSEKSTLRRRTPPNRRRPSSGQIQELGAHIPRIG
jgi:hypothetical protein